MRLETERLIVRTFEPDDGAPWVALVNDPEVLRYVPPSPAVTLEGFAGVLERRRNAESECGHAMWAVESKASGAFNSTRCGRFNVRARVAPAVA